MNNTTKSILQAHFPEHVINAPDVAVIEMWGENLLVKRNPYHWLLNAVKFNQRLTSQYTKNDKLYLPLTYTIDEYYGGNTFTYPFTLVVYGNRKETLDEHVCVLNGIDVFTIVNNEHGDGTFSLWDRGEVSCVQCENAWYFDEEMAHFDPSMYNTAKLPLQKYPVLYTSQWEKDKLCYDELSDIIHCPSCGGKLEGSYV